MIGVLGRVRGREKGRKKEREGGQAGGYDQDTLYARIKFSKSQLNIIFKKK